MYFAYTNQSWWQLYADDQPFRETHHEPELFLRFRNDHDALGLRNRIVDLGIVRESNGRSALELTWSRRLSGVLRLYAQLYIGYGESLLDYDRKVNRLGVGISINDYLLRCSS